MKSDAAARGNPPSQAPAPSQAAPALPVWTVEHQLYKDEGVCGFEFFQAIRLLTLLNLKDRVLIGEDGPPHKEIVRLQAHLSLAFPASAIQKLVRDTAVGQPPRMTVNFMGLTGPNGVLPRPYTERLWTDAKAAEKTALQDWLDLFNHRFISLFYRAWEKYHFFLPFERGAASQRDPDAFSRSLYSMIGLGFRSHRNRFRVVALETQPNSGDAEQPAREKELVRLDDLSLLRFGGFFAHRPRCAVSLEVFLNVTLGLPVKVLQFQGQWLQLNRDSQTTVGTINTRMGQDILVGDRVWDVQSKVRIQLGPLSYDAFQELLPDRNPLGPRKKIFLLAQLVQFYLGAELDVEFQLLLKQEAVPATRTGFRTRLGWDSWSRTKSYPSHANDTVFTVSDRARLG
ncbi:MAG: type VI secretion system baseplate subunit TssG [Planctomycetes bacterium]|nr:type VI secretion system baseplate subunit TssG [Planctomycetota bacterium]